MSQILYTIRFVQELCLYLDEERSQISCITCGSAFRRDDGDGSSSNSTNSPEEYHHHRGSTNTATIEDHILVHGDSNDENHSNDPSVEPITRTHNRNSTSTIDNDEDLLNRASNNLRSGSSSSTTGSLPPPPPLPEKDEKGVLNSKNSI